MKPLGSVAAVIAAIREDAVAEAETIEGGAQAAIERIRSSDATDVVTFPERERRLAAARQQAQARLAQEDWEDTRAAVAEREAWLARAVALGRQQLAEFADVQTRCGRLAILAREGLARLPGSPCEIVVSEADVPLLGPEWRRAVAEATGRDDVRVMAGPLEGGCLLRTSDGRASFDNSYAGRDRRLQARWRSALAALYERAVSVSALGTPPERALGD
jgi:vacuolar-type H+-ATPase subunit E/Vma4